ncbi:ankyrin repeat domain-containing protein [Aliarcobacter cryaerophilus]|uniref:ankyrin repeat domain-containing protein n=1 Tax=Aliarcobacter cryaerophilus TaxID=28198 RepID=UPI0021B63887|nr:ankyrin repeat domain-containing protein [Aliarcobacter cryaerophilus]MCT7486201.1 ankyrin repeat domain-containing protein [Aliarcobacter cryaerophilus]MCT7490264.1 ankyrin repeat domain-containing protein [Aliarcobacter cryaerophilus]
MSTITETELINILEVFSNKDENEILEILNNYDGLQNLTKDGANLLHFAVGRNNIVATKLLLEHGFDSNSVDENNSLTSIHIAAINGNSEIIKILIEYDANINQVDDENLTALHYAYKNNRQEVINVLLENGANEKIKDIDGKAPSEYYSQNTQDEVLEKQNNVNNKIISVDNKQNINVFIKENIESIGDRIYIVGYHEQNRNLDEKKLNNAAIAFNCEDNYQSIIAVYDNTLMKSGKDGLLFTGKKMVHKEYGDFEYDKIQSVQHKYIVTVDDKGKEHSEEYVLITKDNKKYKFEKLYDMDYPAFANFLNIITNEFDTFEEEEQIKALEEMSENIKLSYLKIIVNMTFVDDQNIDEKELAEILLLLSRITNDKETRFKIRAYMSELSLENMESVESLVNILKNEAKSSHIKSIMFSLVKDLINVYYSSREDKNREFQFLNEYKNLFGVTKEDINIAFTAVEADHRMITEDLDDTQIEKIMKDMLSKAGAAGVPLAAIYISGSVVGMSAAGITSGLATLGLGLGMTGGLVVVGLISIATYKGLKHLTGANELDKYKTRELMLHEVIKQTQRTISMLIEDINYVVQKLNDLLLNHSEQTEKIQKLVTIVAQYQNTMKVIDDKSRNYQNKANRLTCPKKLDISRLESMTKEPTKRPLFDFIVSNYEKKKVKIDGVETIEYILKSKIKTEVLEKMGKAFEVLGYFEMSNIVKDKATNFIGGLFGKK